jgi:hypothetical protein
MKTKCLIATFESLCMAVLTAHAQGIFQNLDFESANLSPTPSEYGGYVPIASALPGWTASIGGVAVTQVAQDDYTLGEAYIDIFGPNWNSINPGIIDGNYTVFLQAFIPAQGEVTISQTGTIPADEESLQFKAWSFMSENTLSVSFAGNSLSPVVISSGASPAGQGYDVYGVNIASYAGETGQLEFSALANGTTTQVELDDITFSTAAVTPEPNTLALVLMGGLALAARRWRGRGTS